MLLLNFQTKHSSEMSGCSLKFYFDKFCFERVVFIWCEQWQVQATKVGGGYKKGFKEPRIAK